MGDRIQCALCKDIIESKHVHDFRWCKCKSIFIDGGNEYTRVGGEPENIIYQEDIKDE